MGFDVATDLKTGLKSRCKGGERVEGEGWAVATVKGRSTNANRVVQKESCDQLYT